MGLQHLFYPVVQQGSESMGCWAASMSWWAKAVKGQNYTMGEIAEMYKSIMAPPPSGKTIGGLDGAGRKQMFADSRWRLWQSKADLDDFDMKLIDMYLDSSPVLIAYYDPKLGGSHMNVIVAKVPFTETQMFVMDPNDSTYQRRDLQFYRENSKLFHIASLRSPGW